MSEMIITRNLIKRRRIPLFGNFVGTNLLEKEMFFIGCGKTGCVVRFVDVTEKCFHFRFHFFFFSVVHMKLQYDVMRAVFFFTASIKLFKYHCLLVCWWLFIVTGTKNISIIICH